jgi:hypothetical protein
MLADGVVPPLPLKVTVLLIISHCAYNFCADVIVTFVSVVTLVPPLAEVYQPLNVYPVREVLGSVP